MLCNVLWYRSELDEELLVRTSPLERSPAPSLSLPFTCTLLASVSHRVREEVSVAETEKKFHVGFHELVLPLYAEFQRQMSSRALTKPHVEHQEAGVGAEGPLLE